MIHRAIPVKDWKNPVSQTAAIRTNIAAKKMSVVQSMDLTTSNLCDEKTRTGRAAANPIRGRGMTIAAAINEIEILAIVSPIRITSEH